MYKYESPINLNYLVSEPKGSITDSIKEWYKIMERVEDEYLVTECIKKLEVNVDKEELLKALSYDRDQYDAGYRDGRADGYKEGFNSAVKAIFKAFQNTGEKETTDVNA